MNFDDLADTCFDIWYKAYTKGTLSPTVAILGPPGVGKTSAGRHLATLQTAAVREVNPKAEPAQCRVLDLSSMLPEDLLGLPHRDGPVTRYCPQSWLAPLCEKGAYGVLILDDLPAAPVQVQVAARQLSLERRVHDMYLSDTVFIIVTGNRREDKSAASTLPAHFRNSVVLLSFNPNFKGWEQWYLGRELDSDIAAFLHYKKEHFSRLPKDADKRGAFATPRTWAMLGDLTTVVKDTMVDEIAQGLVGEGVAAEFVAFRLLRRELVPPDRVLADPERAIPNPERVLDRPDRMVAMVTGIGELSAKRWKGKGGPEAMKAYLYALAHITAHKREWVAVSISTYSASGGDMATLLEVAGKNRGKNAKIRQLLDYLATAMDMDG